MEIERFEESERSYLRCTSKNPAGIYQLKMIMNPEWDWLLPERSMEKESEIIYDITGLSPLDGCALTDRNQEKWLQQCKKMREQSEEYLLNPKGWIAEKDHIYIQNTEEDARIRLIFYPVPSEGSYQTKEAVEELPNHTFDPDSRNNETFSENSPETQICWTRLQQMLQESETDDKILHQYHTYLDQKNHSLQEKVPIKDDSDVITVVETEVTERKKESSSRYSLWDEISEDDEEDEESVKENAKNDQRSFFGRRGRNDSEEERKKKELRRRIFRKEAYNEK